MEVGHTMPHVRWHDKHYEILLVDVRFAACLQVSHSACTVFRLHEKPDRLLMRL